MIIDEAQNLTPLEAKTIITRVGHGTKIVFTGDPYQMTILMWTPLEWFQLHCQPFPHPDGGRPH